MTSVINVVHSLSLLLQQGHNTEGLNVYKHTTNLSLSGEIRISATDGADVWGGVLVDGDGDVVGQVPSEAGGAVSNLSQDCDPDNRIGCVSSAVRRSDRELWER